MGSLGECRIEGFICRLCSTIDRNVIHIYSDEGESSIVKNTLQNFQFPWTKLSFAGLSKKLEQKINVYLKINVSKFIYLQHEWFCNWEFQLKWNDPLPKVICLQCDEKLDQHHKFIQRVIQNQKRIFGDSLGQRVTIASLTISR